MDRMVEAMQKDREVSWTGRSGTKYLYTALPLQRPVPPEPGNYIFCKLSGRDQWQAIFSGETEDLSDSLNRHLKTHRKYACIMRSGASYVHIRLNQGGEAARQSEEKDIRAQWRPPCNR
jgi:hypothetical protein